MRIFVGKLLNTNMMKYDEELVEGCKRFLEEMNRIEAAKKQKEEEEKPKAARRKYWAKMLYSDNRDGVTVIIPKDSKLK